MLTEREAVAGIALLAMYADGLIAAEEDDVLRERLLRFPDVFNVDEAELGRMLSRVEKLGEDEGPERFLATCVASVRPATRALAYRVAAEIVVADGELAPEEDEFLAALRVALGLTAEQADAVHDAVEGAQPT